MVVRRMRDGSSDLPGPVDGGDTTPPAVFASFERVHRTFKVGSREIKAVAGIDLEVPHRAAVGLIGESGSGKSTVARLALRLELPDAGRVVIDGVEHRGGSHREARASRRSVGVVFQEPFAALNPRMRVGSIIQEPLDIHEPRMPQPERQEQVLTAMDRAGLERALIDRYPGQMSGGQQQRVGIARAIVLEPAFLVLDEPTASLDVSVRAQILATLRRLRSELGIGYLLISHDIASVRSMTEWVHVMYRGQIVESGPTAEVTRRPLHPYTRALMDSALHIDPDRPLGSFRLSPVGLSDGVPDQGCLLAPRCPIADESCLRPIDLLEVEGRQVRCHRTDVLQQFVHDDTAL